MFKATYMFRQFVIYILQLLSASIFIDAPSLRSLPAKAKDLNPAIRHDYCPVNTNAVFQDYQIISIVNIIIILLPYKILNLPHYHSCSRLLFGSQCNLAIMSPKFRTTNFAFGMTTHFLCNFNEFIFQFIPAFNSINMPSKLSLKDFWTSVSLNYRIFK